MGKVHRQMRKLYTDPLFLVGISIRIALIFLVLPVPVADWYVPFLEASLAKPALDPWAVWLGQGGTLAAFPYGYAMWLVFLPLTLICKLFGLPLHLGYAITLLVADLGLLAVFRRLLTSRERLLLDA